MPASSREYINALCTGNYLLFLEWPQWAMQHYAVEDKGADADDMLTLLIFEWMQHDFCDENVQQLAVLYAVHELEHKPLRGALSYALTTLTLAAFQCMVYQKRELREHYRCKEVLNKEGVLRFMHSNDALLNPEDLRTNLAVAEARFFTLVSDTDPALVREALWRIDAICQLRYLVEDYLDRLRALPDRGDPLLAARISLVTRLAQYVRAQTESTPKVAEELAAYVDKIMEMQPQPFEEEYLNGLAPASLLDISWKKITTFSVRFFDLLQATPHAALTMGKEPPAEHHTAEP